jgi:predicted nucleic acid-binding protein
VSVPEYIDTNVVVRFVAGDHPDHSPRARAYLEALDQPPNEAPILEGVLIEAINVLTSPRLYAFPRERAAEALSDILKLRGLRIGRKRVCLRALQL